MRKTSFSGLFHGKIRRKVIEQVIQVEELGETGSLERGESEESERERGILKWREGMEEGEGNLWGIERIGVERG